MSEKKKIIVVGPGYPYRNGQSIYLSSLCNKLTGKFNVELISFTMLYPSFLFPGKTQYDQSKERKRQFPNKRMLNSLNPVSWWKTAKYINRQKPDLIVIDWWHPFLGMCYNGLVSSLSKGNKGKVIFVTENVISHEANKSDTFLTRLALRHAKAFVALSAAVEQHLKRIFHKKIYRSALPVYGFYKSENIQDIAQIRSRYGFEHDDIVLLFFGLVRKYKGLDLLMEAFANLSAKYPNLKLMAVGEFYDKPEPYETLAQSLGINKNMIIENRYVPDEGVAPYFEMCDCVVLPYRSATQSGILSVAYGFEKPVIVTDVGELGAMVVEGETGTIASNADVASIQDAIERYLILRSNNISFHKNIENYLAEHDVFQKVDLLLQEIAEDFESK